MAKARHRGVQLAFVIHDSPVRPQAANQVFPSDDFPGPLDQGREHLEGLIRQAHSQPVFANLASPQVDFERAEASLPPLESLDGHRTVPSAAVYHSHYGFGAAV